MDKKGDREPSAFKWEVARAFSSTSVVVVVVCGLKAANAPFNIYIYNLYYYIHNMYIKYKMDSIQEKESPAAQTTSISDLSSLPILHTQLL